MKNYYITESGDKVEIIDSEIIHLSHRNITDVVITNLPSCEMLYLNNNELKSVEIDLPLCNTLYLYRNNIKSVGLNLPLCNRLHLSDNELESVELDLPVCSTLYLNNNELKSVELNLPMCRRLDLQNNKIKSVELNLPVCFTLYLHNNKLESADLNLPLCNTLYLYNNELKSVDLDMPVCNVLYSDSVKFIQSSGDVIIGFDGTPTIVDSEKKLGEFTIYSGRYRNNNKEVYVASRGKYYSHGDTMKKAIEDCNFKFLQTTIDVGPYFAECREKGIMSISDYRLLTGACESGCKNFLESKGISSTEMKFDDAMKLLEENEPYGWNKIKELI